MVVKLRRWATGYDQKHCSKSWICGCSWLVMYQSEKWWTGLCGFERRMSNLVKNKWMHIMNIFPFVWVRYVMYCHGKHEGTLETLWIQWNVMQGRIGRLHVWANGDFAVTHTFSHKSRGWSRRADDTWWWQAWIKKEHLSLLHILLKKPIVIQLVQVQLRAFQLQIRAELQVRIDNQARSHPKTQALR